MYKLFVLVALLTLTGCATRKYDEKRYSMEHPNRYFVFEERTEIARQELTHSTPKGIK